jgi:hypothetical protein
MEETTVPGIEFFEGLLKHKPIKNAIIKQLSLLDSLTLIRFINVSPKLAEFAKDDSIWWPRIKAKWGGKYYEPSEEFPGMFMTTYLYARFPSPYDVFIFLVSGQPHVWVSEGRVLNVQDWDRRVESDIPEKSKQLLLRRWDIDTTKSKDYYLWTRERGSIWGVEATLEEYRKGNLPQPSSDIWARGRSERRFSLVPRLGFWFKQSRDKTEFAVVQTSKIPSKSMLFNYNVLTAVYVDWVSHADLPKVYTFNGIGFDRSRDINKVSLVKHMRDADFLEFAGNNLPQGRSVLLRNARGQVDMNFTMTVFVDRAGSVECYRVNVEPYETKMMTYLPKGNPDTDVVLYSKLIQPDIHTARPDQFEFLIDSCITCNKPATLQCSGCNRAVYCGEECGKEGWTRDMHSHVCTHI